MELTLTTKEKDSKLVALVDGDVVAYKVAFGMDDQQQGILSRLDRELRLIMDNTGAVAKNIILSGKNNFRDDIGSLKQYKGNRYNPDGSRKTPQPKYLGYVRKLMETRYAANVAEGEEADDMLAYMQHYYNDYGDMRTVICTIDKDLRICPGNHYNMYTQKFDNFTDPLGSIYLDKKGKLRGEGVKFFFTQTLMGDSTDNIPGLPMVTKRAKKRFGMRAGGFGEKAAYAVIAQCSTEQECINNVLWCYEDFYEGEETPTWLVNRKPVEMPMTHWKTGEPLSPFFLVRFHEMARLLWMRSYPGEMYTLTNEQTREFLKWNMAELTKEEQNV